MKNILHIGLILLSFCFVALGQKTEEQKSELPQNWELLDDSEFSIQYPDTFKLDLSGKMGASFMLFSNLSSPLDKFSENLNLMSESLNGSNLDLDAYLKLAKSNLERMLTDVNIIESTRVSEGDSEYHKLVFIGRQGQFILKWVQHYRVINNKAYVLTFTCEKSEYEAFSETMEKIMQTFKVK